MVNLYSSKNFFSQKMVIFKDPFPPHFLGRYMIKDAPNKQTIQRETDNKTEDTDLWRKINNNQINIPT